VLLTILIVWQWIGLNFIAVRPGYAYLRNGLYAVSVDTVSSGVTIYNEFLISIAAGFFVANLFATLLPTIGKSGTYVDSCQEVKRQLSLYVNIGFMMIVASVVIATSMVYTLGYIPLFSGRSFIEHMYELDYGPLYRFRISFGYAIGTLLLLLSSVKRTGRIYVVALLGALVVLGAMDGKRDTVLAGILLGIVMISKRDDQILPREIYIIVPAAIVAYLSIFILRTGQSLSNFTTTEILGMAGAEYSDFVIFAAMQAPGSIANYSWFKSSLGALLPDLFLSSMGLDKEHLVMQGSAYALQALTRSDFGVRVGLIGELWLAYGPFGLAAAFAFAFLFRSLEGVLHALRDGYLALFVGMLLAQGLAIFATQNTVLFGSVLPAAYVLGAAWGGLYILGKEVEKAGAAVLPLGHIGDSGRGVAAVGSKSGTMA